MRTRRVWCRSARTYRSRGPAMAPCAPCHASVNVLLPVTPQFPVIYPPQPHISLSQIPYTGFDLGPWGNAMYWVALVMFAGSGAYLVLYGSPSMTRGVRRTIRSWALGIDRRLGVRT